MRRVHVRSRVITGTGSALFGVVLASAAGRPVFDCYNVVEDPSHLGYVLRFVDRNDPSHWLEQTNPSLQVQLPQPHADFGGRLCVTFTGAERYVSNRSAAYWAFWHNGVPVSSFALATVTGVGSGARIASTRTNGIGNTIAINTPTTHLMYVFNGTTGILAPGVSAPLDVPRLWSFRYTEGAPNPESYWKLTGFSAQTADSSGAPTASAPEGPLTLGANVNGTLPFIGRFAFLFFGPDVGTSGAALIHSYVERDYGVAA